ncbi:hypothetical protein Val02_21350 [Virgisporangium aliadipatigenens]|uniref:Ricin B lectin domain-containing protein n=1 Tax=Virgisporangium aliadipatigenens TaxID=741659 RepID=A0A8J4DP83_9ACTN|nr:hypothetical protein [Virgisporangium aliadipatigenens]GIJ45249.1 hypothetical protein Val02_21350 [Virgisporangium aliadipatigenens]
MTASVQLASAVHAAEARATGGDPSGAAAALTEAVDAAKAGLGADHLDVLAASYLLAGLHRRSGALLAARRVLEPALEAGRRMHGDSHQLLLSMTYELAVVSHELGHTTEAERHFEVLRRLGPEALGAEHAYVEAARGYRGADNDRTVVLSTVDVLRVDPALERRRRIVAAAAVSGVAALALIAVTSAVVLVRGGPERASHAGAPVFSPTGSVRPTASVPSDPPLSLAASEGAVVAAEPPAPSAARTPSAAASPSGGPAAIGGVYRIRTAHSGLCVGEGPESGRHNARTVLGQHPCASASPPLRVEPVAQGGYRILLERGGNRTACVTVDYGGVAPGLAFAARECGDGRPDQRFTFEAVNAPAAGYRLRSVSGARYCVGVRDGSGQSGVPLVQADCNPRATHQVFALEKR